MHLELWQPYIIAAAVGLLVGIEREKAHASGKTMGVRTFLLIALLGAIARGVENNWVAVMIAGFCFALIVVSYFNVTRSQARPDHRGLTTEFAAAIIFCLGFVAHTRPMLASLLGPVVAVVLFSKASLHRFTARIKPVELQAALLLLLFGASVVHLLPDETIDPWQLINPRKFGILILVLAALEFTGYVLVKMIGEKKGSLAIGFLGGLVSSTAVTLSNARQAKRTPQAWRRLAASTLAATLASLAELLLIVGLVSQPLLFKLSIPVTAALAVGLIALTLFIFRASQSDSDLELKSPLDWRGVMRLAFLLAAMTLGIAVLKRWLGDTAIYTASAFAGLFELHGVTLANSTMLVREQISESTAFTSILLACAASFLAKTTAVWLITRNRFSQAMTLSFLMMAAALWLSTFAL